MRNAKWIVAAAVAAGLAVPSAALADPVYNSRNNVRVVVNPYAYGSGYAPYAGYSTPYNSYYGNGGYSSYGNAYTPYGYSSRAANRHARKHEKAERRHERRHQRQHAQEHRGYGY